MRKTKLEREITEPLGITEFAKYIGMTSDAIHAMKFGPFTHLMKKHGFWITGDGILPKPGGYPKEKK